MANQNAILEDDFEEKIIDTPLESRISFISSHKRNPGACTIGYYICGKR